MRSILADAPVAACGRYSSARAAGGGLKKIAVAETLHSSTLQIRCKPLKMRESWTDLASPGVPFPSPGVPSASPNVPFASLDVPLASPGGLRFPSGGPAAVPVKTDVNQQVEEPASAVPIAGRLLFRPSSP